MAPREFSMAAWLLVGLAGTTSALLTSRATYLPSSVQMLSVPAEDEPITLEVALKMQNIDRLEDMLRDVSEPASPNYGKHLSAAEVNDLFMPAEESSAAVKAWLEAHDITDIVDKGYYINFATTVSNANKLLNSSFSYYNVQGKRKLRTREYSIDGEVSEHIELVTPTTYFGTVKSRSPVHIPPPKEDSQMLSGRQQPEPNCARLITPPCTKEMYEFGGYEADPESGSRVAFASFLNQSSVPSDLEIFLEMFDLPRTTFESVIINGADDHQSYRDGVEEGNLDAQMLAISAQSLPMIHYLTGGSPPFVPNLRLDEYTNTNEPFVEFFQYLMTLENDEIAQVISISYGDDEQTVPRDYAVRTCNLMGMMGLRGVSLIESTGDSGVGAPCRANDGSDKVEFTPQFPPSCPYITTIGGTRSYDPEIAWEGSSGGFSNYFERAWYQREAVGRYLDEVMDKEQRAEYDQYADYRGRAYPDISGHSSSPYYQIIIGGATSFSGGTSAAAPLIAGMIGLLNDARLRAGKPVMGFLNPWIYGVASGAFRDITAGYAKGCDGYDTQTGTLVPGAGLIGDRGAFWNATEGWDPSTGLGTPKFAEMLEAAMADARPSDDGDREEVAVGDGTLEDESEGCDGIVDDEDEGDDAVEACD